MGTVRYQTQKVPLYIVLPIYVLCEYLYEIHSIIELTAIGKVVLYVCTLFLLSCSAT